MGKVQRPTLPTELLGAAIAWWGLSLPLRGEGYVTCEKTDPLNMRPVSVFLALVTGIKGVFCGIPAWDE